MSDQKLQWHPAFQAALQIELEEDAPYLQFQAEYNLAKKPQQIDLIIRKKEGYVCQKKLARLFRGHNIIEYKSPGDYFSVNDFYKLMSYAGNYQSNTKKILEIRPEDITLTIVCDRFPRRLEEHLHERYKTKVREKYPGIYYIDKMPLFPAQIVVTRQLEPNEYLWLSRLRQDLKIETDIDPLSKAYKGKEKDPLYEAVMDLIMRANKNQYEEAKEMCDALRELFSEELEQARNLGLSLGISQGISRGISQGISQGRIQGFTQGRTQGLTQGTAGGIGYIRNMYRHQLSAETIAELIGQNREYVEDILALITEYPSENDESITQRLLRKQGTLPA